jgi:hypothetical protein
MINTALRENNYKKAFDLLVIVLDAVEDECKIKLINYYIQYIYNMQPKAVNII